MPNQYKRALCKVEAKTQQPIEFIRKHRFLIVDDDERDCRELIHVLEKVINSTVSCVHSISQFRAESAKATPDVVFLDIGLPDGDGLDEVPRIRNMWPKAAIVVYSEKTLPQYVIQESYRGLDGWIGKSLSLERQVLVALSDLLGGNPRMNTCILRMPWRTEPGEKRKLPDRIEFVFESGRSPFTLDEFRVLSAVVSTLHLTPSGESLTRAAYLLARGASSLRRDVRNTGLPTIATIHRGLSVAATVAHAWRCGTTDGLSFAAAVRETSKYSTTRMAKLAKGMFKLDPGQLADLSDIRTITCLKPFPIFFSTAAVPSLRKTAPNGNVLPISIRTVVKDWEYLDQGCIRSQHRTKRASKCT